MKFLLHSDQQKLRYAQYSSENMLSLGLGSGLARFEFGQVDSAKIKDQPSSNQ